MIELWDRHARPAAYIDDDGESVFLWSGAPVAWRLEDALFAYSGVFLGWFIDGWVRAPTGECVFFTDNAEGGPIRPMCLFRPMRGLPGIRPIRGFRAMKPMRPIPSLSWASSADAEFFQRSR